VILADTDVLIDYLAEVSPIAEQISQYVQADRLWTTAVTCFELLSGAEEGKRGNKLREFVDSLNVLPLDFPAAQRAAELRRYLDRTGRAIGMADSMIAGIALLHDLPLFTRNNSHFERVPGLTLVEIERDHPKRR
jgi:predicted nucleic acid-binding protein